MAAPIRSDVCPKCLAPSPQTDRTDSSLCSCPCGCHAERVDDTTLAAANRQWVVWFECGHSARQLTEVQAHSATLHQPQPRPADRERIGLPDGRPCGPDASATAAPQGLSYCSRMGFTLRRAWLVDVLTLLRPLWPLGAENGCISLNHARPTVNGSAYQMEGPPACGPDASATAAPQGLSYCSRMGFTLRRAWLVDVLTLLRPLWPLGAENGCISLNHARPTVNGSAYQMEGPVGLMRAPLQPRRGFHIVAGCFTLRRAWLVDVLTFLRSTPEAKGRSGLRSAGRG